MGSTVPSLITQRQKSAGGRDDVSESDINAEKEGDLVKGLHSIITFGHLNNYVEGQGLSVRQQGACKTFSLHKIESMVIGFQAENTADLH